MKKILILASNPRNDLNLDREIRDLKGVIEKSRNREELHVEDELAVRIEDLQELFLKHRPQIVHFCGHGSGEQGLVFDSDSGREKLLRTEALASLFKLFASTVECVILNACYSETQADAIVNHVNYVIGIKQEIRDDAAIAFSKGFYRALGYNCTLEEAYELGRNAIQLEISGYAKTLDTQSKIQRKAEVVNVVSHTYIPEHLKPILKKKPNPNPGLIETAPPIAPEIKDEIHLDIGEDLKTGFKVKQYRNVVQGFLADRKLSVLEKIRLEQIQRDLSLSAAEAARVLQEEQQPMQKVQDQYAEVLHRLIAADCYPFGLEIQTELQDLIQELGLKEEEAQQISAPILTAAEAEYQRHLQQQAIAAPPLPNPQRISAVHWQRAVLETITVDSTGIENSRTQKFVTFFAENLGNGVFLEMVKIPAGTFLMGSPPGEGLEDERPEHSVVVPTFSMAKYPITQAQWRAIATLPMVEVELEPEPSKFNGRQRPVEQISWYEAVEFCQRLAGLTGRPYRLPSEAEWEYACRAGTTTPFYFGEVLTPTLARYKTTMGTAITDISMGETAAVGSYPANAFGLHDMHGNVYELCADRWHDSYDGAPTNGSAWDTEDDKRRVFRGGSWTDLPRACRSALRDGCSPVLRSSIIGLRVACGPF
jgi:formylglycine-generating enzyme required for sulfatase activity